MLVSLDRNFRCPETLILGTIKLLGPESLRYKENVLFRRVTKLWEATARVQESNAQL